MLDGVGKLKGVIRFTALAIVASIVGWGSAALAATAYSSWNYIDTTQAACGYYRNHVNNSTYKAVANTRNFAKYSGSPCSVANPVSNMPAYYMTASVKLVSENGSFVCGNTGTVYNTSYNSEVHVEAYYVQQTGCRKKSGDYYHASGSGSRWNEGLGGYVSSGPTYSDHLRFW